MLWIVLLTAVICATAGLFFGVRLNRDAYHGALVIQESSEGLKMTLELAGDPESLVFEDSIKLKIVGPDYKKLLSQDKLGV